MSLQVWFRLFVAAVFATLAAGELELLTYANAVFGAPAARSSPPSVALPPFDASAPASFAFAGTLTPGSGTDELLAFSARASGVVRAFVDDHLVLDDSAAGCNRSLATWNAWPARANVSVPFRLEFTHRAADAACPAPVLQLLWEGNVTEPVPSSAFAPPPASGPRAELAALRARLYEPAVPWQTYWAPSMAAHALQPTGLLLQLSVGTVGGAYLGDVRVFPDLKPAWVRAGGHSFNGSDYTAMHVSRWLAGPSGAPLNATVSLFTTAVTAGGFPCAGTEGNGGPRCDLVALAACEGGDCGQLLLVVSASYAWSGQGGVACNATTLTATPAGFAPVTAFAATPPTEALGLRVHSAAFPSSALLLPFSTAASLPWPGPGGGANLSVAVVSTGALRAPDDAVALIAAARTRYDAGALPFGAVADLYEPMRAVLAWNTLYAHFVGVYTPVSRNWYAGDDIGTFVWDVYFAAVMMTTDSTDARARDLACMNVITTTLSRTMSGMVPNYISGQSGTYDRTEPAVGAWAVRVLRDRYSGAALAVDWLPELLLDALAAWNDWFHAARRNVGVLAALGADGLADAISLGSDDTSPPGLNTPHTLAAARYESGLDNSPQYDGDDGQCSGPTCPCTFNASNSLMNLYDVAFTTYHIVDADAIVDLAGPLNRSDVVPRMRERAQRAAAALNSAMYAPALGHGGTYANALLNGTFVPRWAPTVFSPMIAGIVPRERVDAMMALLGDPEYFCVNETHHGSGGPSSTILLTFGAPGAATTASCVSDACIIDAVLTNYGASPGLEGIVLSAAAGPSPTFAEPLNLYLAPSYGGASALATAALAPTDPAFSPARLEGYCAASASEATPVPLTLWSLPQEALPVAAPTDICSPMKGTDYVGYDLENKTTANVGACCAYCEATPGCVLWKWASGDARCYLKSGMVSPTPCPDCIVGTSLPPPRRSPAFVTCGSASCNASAAAAGFVPVGATPMCYSSAASTPLDWPCSVALPAIARTDAAFGDQTYWRGRAWAPQLFLVWLGLQRYADVPSAAAARATLVSMATRTFRRQLINFGQINENLDGLLGLGSDSGRADSYYHWGALNAFVSPPTLSLSTPTSQPTHP